MTSDPAYEASTKAKNQVGSGNAEGAVQTLENYLATDPHNNKLRLQLANIIFYELKDFDYAMMQLDAILDIDPDYTDALIAQVTILGEYKKYNKETDAKYRHLLEIAPSADMYHAYARFLRYQMTDFRQSGEYFERAIAAAPDRYEYRQNYCGLLLNDLKDYVKAKEQLEVLMEMRPGDVMVRNNYDRLMRTRFDKDGNPKKRLSLFKRH